MGTRNEGRTDRQGDGHDIKQKNLNYNRVRERERERERERNEEGCNLRIGKLIPYGEEEEGGTAGRGERWEGQNERHFRRVLFRGKTKTGF